MKKLLTMLFFFLMPAASYGQTQTLASFVQICYTDFNRCMIFGVNIENKRAPYRVIMMRSPDYSQFVNPAIKEAFAKSQLYVNKLTNAEYDNYAKNTTTVYKNSEEELSALEQIPDETVSLIDDVGTCGLAVLACVGGTTAAVMATGPGAMLVARITCGWGGWQCAKAIRTYEKWSRIQAKKSAAEGTTIGSTGANGQGGSGPANGGTSEPVFEQCFPNTVTMGGGPKGEWVEESSVDCYPI